MTEQMLEKLFIEILNMSLTASVMILAVFLARLVLKQAPRIFSYVLWLVVLFRLLCPVSFESEISLLGAVSSETSTQGRMEYIPQDIGYQVEPQVNLPVEALNDVVNGSLPEGNPQGSVNPLQVVLYLGAHAWLLGMGFMLIYSGVSLWKLRRKLKQAVWERGNVYRLPGRGTPFVYGVFRPRIYLPTGLAAEEEEYMLLHEQIHIRRGDAVFRMLAWLALCLHWFNPFVWLAFSFSGRDMEMSCDEAVIQNMGNGVRKEYSASLLNAALGSRIVKGIPLAFGESDTGSRIKHVLRYKKPAKILVGVAAVVCVILAVVLLANPKEEQGEQAEEFLTEYDKGISIRPEKQTPTQDVLPEEILDSWGLDLTAIPDGTYYFSVRGFSRSDRCIDRYVCNSDSEELPELFFAEDCRFYVNGSMNRVVYEELTFDGFADLLEDGLVTSTDQASCYLTFAEGVITQAILKSKYFKYGISYDSYIEDTWLEFVNTSPEMKNADVLKTYFTLERTEEADIGDGQGTEYVEIYTGNMGDGDCGVALFYSAQGDLLHAETAHISRVGWNNIYLGEADGVPYILTVHIEERDTYGGHGYQVYRLGTSGDAEQIAGSFFEFDDGYTPYDDDLFKEWVSDLEYYLEHSHLILSSQEGEVRTEQICELDKYNYETLRRGK